MTTVKISTKLPDVLHIVYCINDHLRSEYLLNAMTLTKYYLTVYIQFYNGLASIFMVYL